jgi:hypothetical protein
MIVEMGVIGSAPVGALTPVYRASLGADDFTRQVKLPPPRQMPLNQAVPLGRQDSNLGSRDQSPLPYRLATPHRPASLRGARRAAPAYAAYPRLRSPSSLISSTSSTTTANTNTKKIVTGIRTATSASRPWAKATIQAASRTGPGGRLRPAKT